MNNNEGYIYIYKCIVGSRSDVIKVGKTKHFNDNMDRMKQHSRTLYYGFVPYTDFKTGKPIATAFKVIDANISDKLVKQALEPNQISNIEIYNIEYEEAIKMVYDLLVSNGQYIDLYSDTYTDYDYLNNSSNGIKNEIRITKEQYEKIRDKIISKYGDNLPESLLVILRDKEEFMKNCRSHYSTGNYIDGFPNNMILDTNFNREIREELLEKLNSFVK